MKKIVIIGSLDSGTKNDPRVLSEHLRERGIEVVTCFWEQLVFDIKTNDVKVRFDGRDIVTDIQPDLVIAIGWYKIGKHLFYRDVAYATALYLEKSGVPFWNKEMVSQRSITKLSCLMQLALEGIPVSSTLFAIDATLIAAPQPPFIVKAIATSRGKSNYLVHSIEEALETIKNDDGRRFLWQPFMPNDHDLRVICFGGQPSLVLRRSRSSIVDSHLNNTSQGGEAEWIDLREIDAELLTLCKKICIVTGREIGGIDFIPDPLSPFGYSCLEVNPIPQLSSGYDTTKKLDMLAAIIKQDAEGDLVL